MHYGVMRGIMEKNDQRLHCRLLDTNLEAFKYFDFISFFMKHDERLMPTALPTIITMSMKQQEITSFSINSTKYFLTLVEEFYY